MLIDAHAHLDKYGEELQRAVEEIEKHRILTIGVSMDLPSYQRNLEIGEMCDLVLPTFGVHPKRAPWLTGTRGMPQVIERVIQAIAEVRETTPEVITRTAQENFFRLIRDDPSLRGWRRTQGLSF